MFYIASCQDTKRTDMDHSFTCELYTMPAFCFASVHQMAPPLTEVTGIWLEHLSTPKGWSAELAWLVDLQRTVYPHKWSPSATGQAQDREVRRPKTNVLPLSYVTTNPRKLVHNKLYKKSKAYNKYLTSMDILKIYCDLQQNTDKYSKLYTTKYSVVRKIHNKYAASLHCTTSSTSGVDMTFHSRSI